MKNKIWTATVVLAWTMGWAGTVGGQEKSPQAELQRGADLARQEKLEEAVGVWLSILGDLQGDDPATAHKYLGVAYKRLEMWPEAWHHLTVYLATSGQTDPDAGAMFQTVEERLRPGHVKVAFACEPAGLVLSIPPSKPGLLHQSTIRPSAPLPSTSLAAGRAGNPQSALVWWFPPGKHTVHAEAEGFVAQDVQVDVRERGDSGQREIRLAAVAPPVKVGRPTGDEKRGETPVVVKNGEERTGGSRTLEWVLLGSGLVLGATGGILQGIGYSRNEELHDDYLGHTGEDAQSQYDDAYANEVRPKEISAYVLYGVGGAVILTSAILWLAREPESSAADSGVSVSVFPTGLPGGGGAVMSLEW